MNSHLHTLNQTSKVFQGFSDEVHCMYYDYGYDYIVYSAHYNILQSSHNRSHPISLSNGSVNYNWVQVIFCYQTQVANSFQFPACAD